ncbi:MAG: hypothetical protein R3F11_09170 [Verrucomicrobiales bacterium]
MTELICAQAQVAVGGRDGATLEAGERRRWAWRRSGAGGSRYPRRRAAAQMAERARMPRCNAPVQRLRRACVEVGTAAARASQRSPPPLNANKPDRAPLGHLPALVCLSPFDIALHDAYGHACDL